MPRCSHCGGSIVVDGEPLCLSRGRRPAGDRVRLVELVSDAMLRQVRMEEARTRGPCISTKVEEIKGAGR